MMIAGMAIGQEVIVGLLATATAARAWCHNYGRSVHCPSRPRDEAAALQRASVMSCLRIVVEEPYQNIAVGSWHRQCDRVTEVALCFPSLATPADALAVKVPALQFERPQLS